MIVPAVLAVAALVAAPTHGQIDDAAWRHVANRKHKDAGVVKVYRSEVAGVTCFKATAATTEVDPGKLLEVALDVVGAKRWSSAGITKAEVLERKGGVLTFMQYLDTPGWTLARDRYSFLTCAIHDGEEEKWLRWKRMDPNGAHREAYREFKQANPKAVEPLVNVGGWHFRKSEGSVSIEYQICTDAGGAIPKWLQHATTRRALPDLVGDLVREAKCRPPR